MENTEFFKKAIHNATTGEEEVVDMTQEEIDDFLLQKEKSIAARQAEELVESNRQAVLDRLGITKDEFNLILGIIPPAEPVANPEPPVSNGEPGKFYFDGFVTSGPPAEVVDQES